MSTPEDPLGIVGKWYRKNHGGDLVEVILYRRRVGGCQEYDCIWYHGGHVIPTYYRFPDSHFFHQVEM